MTYRSVHWHEGMFLWPQQMQQAERFFAHQVHQSGAWDVHYNWGVGALDLDGDALGNSRFCVRALRARLRDGTTVSVPEDTVLPALDLKGALENQSSIDIFLALANVRSGKPNVRKRPVAAREGQAPPPAAAQPEEEAHFLVDVQDLEDENTGTAAQHIEVRLPNAKLLLATEDHAGYSVLHLARVRRATQPEGKPELDIYYIPPLLTCAAWKPLQDGVLQVVYDRFGRKVAKLAAQVVSRGISFDTRNEGDGLVLTQLHNLNEAYAYLKVLAFADGIHPLEAYLELCRFAGKLAIFDLSNPRAPTLPPYDHDDLGGCFFKVKQYLDSIPISEPVYEERPFIGQEQRMQVTLEPKWLEPIWEMYVGVRSSLKPDDCVRLLTKAGNTDMKIGSSTRVDKVFEGGDRGLRFVHSSAPPRTLPSAADLVFFQIRRDVEPAEWQHVQQTLTLAFRLNKDRIVGNIQGQHTLTIKTGGTGSSQTTTMQFTLYLVPRESRD